MQHIVSVRGVEMAELEDLHARADFMREQMSTSAGRLALRRMHLDRAMGRLFYEPSTRTSESFKAAAGRLGMFVGGTDSAKLFSSAAKGESLEDTIEIMSGYYDVIVLRHPDDDAGQRAARVSEVPIIDAGSGKNEHPTQAYLDSYALKRDLGKLTGNHIVLGGDLLHGRTVHSLPYLLPQNYYYGICPPGQEMPQEVIDYIRAHGGEYEETYEMREGLPKGRDAVYWTRPQLERHGDNGSSAGASTLTIDREMLEIIPESGFVYHPMPITSEFTPDVAKDPRARFIQQARGGLYTRMAHLDQMVRQVELG